jgi:hypothetical protein
VPWGVLFKICSRGSEIPNIFQTGCEKLGKKANSTKNPAHDPVFNPQFVGYYHKKPNAIPPYALRIRDHLTECCPELDHISKFQHPKVPPWKIKPPQVNISMNMFNKEKDNPIAIKTAFQEIVEQYDNYILISQMAPKQTMQVLQQLFVTTK